MAIAETATGKPTLVIIETQTGRQTQIWYPDAGGFVGCAHLTPVERFELPGSSFEAPWKIADAVDHITSVLYPEPDQLHNPIGDQHAA